MTVREVVESASNVQEAILALAAGLDAVIARLDAAPPAAEPDPWGTWNAPALPVAEPVEATAYELRAPLTAELAEQLGDLARAMAVATDDNERAAIQAKMNLLLDPGRAPDPVDHGNRVQIEQGDGEATVKLPPVSPERYMRRLAWAKQALLNEGLGGDEDWEEVYAKGGPMWLYLGNRDYVLGLPQHLRAEMVADVEQDSPTDAHELSADILKNLESGGLPEFHPDL